MKTGSMIGYPKFLGVFAKSLGVYFRGEKEKDKKIKTPKVKI